MTTTSDIAAGPPTVLHTTPLEEVVRLLGGGESGLDAPRVEQARQKWGFNELPQPPSPKLWKRFLRQFNDVVIWILILAAGISGIAGEWTDAVVILAIVVLNAVLGFAQEERAGRALAVLRKLSTPFAKVRRDGIRVSVPSREVVPGDLINLDAGDDIPADARLLSCHELSVQESSLTGESAPLAKDASFISTPAIPLADRKNMVYAGTFVTAGSAAAIVIATGPHSEFGKIGSLLRDAKTELTPLQHRLARLAHMLIVASLVVVLLVFALELIRGGRLMTVFITSVALAVAAIPEGLPPIVTIALALGMQRMARRHALVRRLPSVETLGSVTVICTDKTGTLTRGEMAVTEIVSGNDAFHIDATTPNSPDGFTRCGSDQPVDPANEEELRRLLTAVTWCNHAEVSESEVKSNRPVGDPMERALLAAVARARLLPRSPDSSIIGEIPFNSDRRMMSVLVRNRSNGVMMYSKGAPEVVLDRCNQELIAGVSNPLTAFRRTEILQRARELASRALRVLGVADRSVPDFNKEVQSDTNLTFLGLIGMIDPARPEAAAAVKACLVAGIRPVMITGDHPETARAIAESVGILSPESQPITGVELDTLSEKDLAERVHTISVYSRVTAQHKLRIVRAWKARGDIVAMTGDGINDAPAIEAADVGIAMGQTGTDVTRQAADIVLADDNFASIVNAVEEGRSIFANIRKVVHYLLSCNAAEILFMFVAALFGWPVPLTAIHLLWINLITDGLPALALGVDPAEPDLMSHSPRSSKEPLVTTRRGIIILVHAAMISAVSLLSFGLTYRGDDGSLGHARTVAFCTLAYAELFYSLGCRSSQLVIPRLGLLSNPFLLVAVVVSGLLQLAIVTIPAIAHVFDAEALTAWEWMIVLVGSLTPLTLVELQKLLITSSD